MARWHGGTPHAPRCATRRERQLVGRHSGLPACCGGAAGRGRARPGPRRLAADERARAARQNGGDCGDKSPGVQRSGACRLSSFVAFRTRARRATRVAPRGHEPSAIRTRSQKLLARTAADSATARPQLLSTPENWCLICCLPADAAGEPGGPLYYKEVLTRFYLEFFYPHDSERECDRTIGSFSHQSEITREQLSLPLASPPSPSGIRGILWVVQSIDLWRVSQSLDDTMKYSDRHLAGLSARPPDRVELTARALSATGPAPASAEG